MLRNVLPLGSGAYNAAETNNKLLELADRDANEEATINPDDTQREETESEVDPMAIASVVTQVNTVDSRPGTSAHADDIDGRTSWRSKFRQVGIQGQILTSDPSLMPDTRIISIINSFFHLFPPLSAGVFFVVLHLPPQNNTQHRKKALLSYDRLH